MASRASQMTYDPTTGKWNPSGSSSSSSSNKDDTSTPSGNTGSSGSSTDNLNATTGDSESSAGTAQKENNSIVMNTLEGSLTFVANEDTIQLNAGDTVELKGLGKYLSGYYYVTEVTRNISSDGYSHTATVIKTDFGSSLKSSSTTTDGNSTPAQEETVTSSSTSDTTTPSRTYTVKKGDCLWNIAKSYYGSGTQWNKIYDANTKQIVNPNLIYPGQELVIP